MEGGATFFKRSTQPGYSEVTASPPCSLHLHSLLVFLLTPCLFCSFHTHIFLFLSPCISFPSSWSPLLIVAFSQISCLPALWFHLRYMKTSFLSLLTFGPPRDSGKPVLPFIFFLKSCGWCISRQLERQWKEGRPLPPPSLQVWVNYPSFLRWGLERGTYRVMVEGKKQFHLSNTTVEKAHCPHPHVKAYAIIYLVHGRCFTNVCEVVSILL